MPMRLVRDRARCICERLQSGRWRSSCDDDPASTPRSPSWRTVATALAASCTRRSRLRFDCRGSGPPPKGAWHPARDSPFSILRASSNPRLNTVRNRPPGRVMRNIAHAARSNVELRGDAKRVDQDRVGRLAKCRLCARYSSLYSASYLSGRLRPAWTCRPPGMPPLGAWGRRRRNAQRWVRAFRERTLQTRWRCWRFRMPCSRRPCTSFRCDRSGFQSIRPGRQRAAIRAWTYESERWDRTRPSEEAHPPLAFQARRLVENLSALQQHGVGQCRH